MSDGKSIGSVEYTRKDGKVDGGRIVKLVEVESRAEPYVYEYSDELDIMLDPIGSDTYGKMKKYVVAIAEVG